MMMTIIIIATMTTKAIVTIIFITAIIVKYP